jgi:hypothetical protein
MRAVMAGRGKRGWDSVRVESYEKIFLVWSSKGYPALPNLFVVCNRIILLVEQEIELLNGQI